MGKLMVANKERGDRMWEMSHRLCLATVYGAKTLGHLQHRKAIMGKIQKAITELLREDLPRSAIREDDPVLMEELSVPTYFSKPLPRREPKGNKKSKEAERTSRVWALVTLPEKTPENTNLFKCQNFRVLGEYGREAIILVPFPWELPETQWFRIGRTPATTRNQDVVEAIERMLGPRIKGNPQVSKGTDKSGQMIWNIRLNFNRRKVEGAMDDNETVVDTLGTNERQWKIRGDEWHIWPGTHCTGCHGVGHTENKCELRPHISPLDRRPNDQLPDEAEEWPIEVYLRDNQPQKGRQKR
jgi:hypothetical protein